MDPANSPERASHRYSPFGRVFRLAKKELREILRDRRTIVTLVAMPLLLYPLMSIVFKQLYLANRPSLGPRPEYRVAALTLEEWVAFERRFNFGRDVWLKKQGKVLPERRPIADRTIPQVHPFRDPLMQKIETEAQRNEVLERLKHELREGRIDLVITVDDLDQRAALLEEPTKDWAWTCRIHLVRSHPHAQAALAEVERMFALANEHNLKQRLGLKGARPRVTMLSVERSDVELPGGAGVISLAALVPLILILMTITGAVYPAIDLTAGERERGTLEILVAAPVARFELLTAKYLSVFTIALMTALVNLVCMMITISWSGLGAALFREQEFSVLVLLQVFALLLLFAAFFSALLLCLTSFARSFKEAQAYLIPLMLASLTPGVMGMLPGLELKGLLTVIPLVNIVLMARDLFEKGVEPAVAATVVLTTLFYALAALALAARVFGAENVLYSEQSGWADLFRRPEMPQSATSLPMALWCLALMVPLHFALTALAGALTGLSLSTRVLLSIPINLLLFGCFPAVFLYLGRVDVMPGLGLSAPNGKRLGVGLIAGAILGASLWPLELAALAQSGITAEIQERFADQLQKLHQVQQQLGWSILSIVIVPAILEEFFFRGMLYEALARRLTPLATVGMTGLLFGLAHVILDGALGLERLAPSTFLGLVLSAVRWRTGTIWPAVVLHVLHNTILLIIGIAEPGSTPEIKGTWIAGGVTGALVGVALLWCFGRSNAPEPRVAD